MNRTIFTPGDRVRLLTIGQDRQLDGGHRPAVFDHIGHDGFARVHADGIGLPLVVELDRLVLEPEQVNELTVAQAQAATRVATPPRPCINGCEDTDDHSRVPFPTDAACWTPGLGTALNLEFTAERGNTVQPPSIEVCGHRPFGAEECVYLHLQTDAVDTGVMLTGYEARRIAAHLIKVANLLEGVQE